MTEGRSIRLFVASGRNANGRTSWCVAGTKKRYSDWQDENISQQSIETEQGEAKRHGR